MPDGYDQSYGSVPCQKEFEGSTAKNRMELKGIQQYKGRMGKWSLGKRKQLNFLQQWKDWIVLSQDRQHLYRFYSRGRKGVYLHFDSLGLKKTQLVLTGDNV